MAAANNDCLTFLSRLTPLQISSEKSSFTTDHQGVVQSDPESVQNRACAQSFQAR